MVFFSYFNMVFNMVFNMPNINIFNTPQNFDIAFNMCSTHAEIFNMLFQQFSTHIIVLNMPWNFQHVFNTPWNIQHSFEHALQFSTYAEILNTQHALQFSEHSEIFNMLFYSFQNMLKILICFFIVFNTLFQYAFNMHCRFQHALKFSTHFQTWKFETFTVKL